MYIRCLTKPKTSTPRHFSTCFHPSRCWPWSGN